MKLNFNFKKNWLEILFVLGFALLAAGYLLYATQPHGIGVSADSVNYIAGARNLIARGMYFSYLSTPIIPHPPVFSSLLALAAWVLQRDPITLTRYLQSVIFAALVLLTLIVGRYYVRLSWPMTLIAGLGVLLSKPIVMVSLWVWTEPLFALWCMLLVLTLYHYARSGGWRWIWPMGLLIGLLFLTRYAGFFAVIVVGGSMLFYHAPAWGESWRTRRLAPLRPLLLQGLAISAWVLLLTVPWMARNYSYNHTLLAHRGDSVFTLIDTLRLTGTVVLGWLAPSHLPLWLRGSLAAGLLLLGLVLALRLSAEVRRDWLRRVWPPLWLAGVYLVFITVLGSQIEFDPLDDRFLSPAYIPGLLVLLSVVDAAIGHLGRARPAWQRAALIMALGGMWLALLSQPVVQMIGDSRQVGLGYRSREWQEKRIVRYINRHPEVLAGCKSLYSNVPDSWYVLANRSVNGSPLQRANALAVGITLESLRGAWPPPSSCILWYRDILRPYQFNLTELATIAAITPLYETADGGVYRVEALK